MTTATTEGPHAAVDQAIEPVYHYALPRNVTLTPRETQILTLIARGYSNQEIAEALYLSINSIKTYIRSAYRRIGVERRTQAVLWALNHALPPTMTDPLT